MRLVLFPQTIGDDGLSLRDYFAAAALTGLLAGGSEATRAGYTESAYKFADAMLDARKRGPDAPKEKP